MQKKNKQIHSNGQKTRLSVPSFLVKTYDMIENDVNRDIICWSKDGNSFIIKNVTEFCDKVLSNYFKHNNFASFVRQLNMYDFHKIRNENNESEFRHKLFKKGHKNLLVDIRRKSGDNNYQQIQSESISENGNQSSECDPPQLEKIKQEYMLQINELSEVKNKQSDLQKTIQVLIAQNQQLLNENKLLWDEIRRNKEKEEKKTEKIFYFMSYLLQAGQQGVIGNNGLSFINQIPCIKQFIESDDLQQQLVNPNKQNGQSNINVKKEDWAAVTSIEKDGEKIPVCQLKFNKGKKKDNQLNQTFQSLMNNILNLNQNEDKELIENMMKSYYKNCIINQDEAQKAYDINLGTKRKMNNTSFQLYDNSKKIMCTVPQLPQLQSINQIIQSPILERNQEFEPFSPMRQILNSQEGQNQQQQYQQNISHPFKMLGNNSPLYKVNTPNLSPLLLRDYDEFGLPKSSNSSIQNLDQNQ